MLPSYSGAPFWTVSNHNKGYNDLVRIFQHFIDTFLSFIGLFCHSSSRETNQMWTSFTTSRCRLAKEKKALKTTRIILMALLLCSLPMILYTVFFQAYNNSGSYIVNVIVLSHSVMLSFHLFRSILCWMRWYIALEIRRSERRARSCLKWITQTLTRTKNLL